MRIRTGLSIAVTVAAAAVGINASPAAAMSFCRPVYSPPILSGNHVSIEGFLFCADPDDPRDGAPLGVALQRQSATAWVTVATGNGEAVYACTGTSARTYRSARLPTRPVTLNCS